MGSDPTGLTPARQHACGSAALAVVAAVAWATYAGLVAVFWASTNATESVVSSPWWARMVGELGGWVAVPAITVLLGLALLLAGYSRAAILSVGAVAGAGVLAYVSKVAFQLIGADDDGGRIADFPSTHVAVTVAFAGVLTVLVWRGSENRTLRALVAVVAVAVSITMGWARVAEGTHSVVDVLGGACLGVAWLATWMLALASIRSIRAWVTAALCVSLAGFAFLAVAHDEEPLASVDREAAEQVVSSLPSWAESLARAPSWFGSWMGMTILAIVVVVALLRERGWLDFAFFATALAGSQVIVALLETWFDRPRPHLGSVIAYPSSASFPSAHATAGVAILGAAAVLATERLPSRRTRVWLWTTVVVASLAVGASQIVLNVQYVTDVVAGWCLGLAWLAACLLTRDRLRRGEGAGSTALGESLLRAEAGREYGRHARREH